MKNQNIISRIFPMDYNFYQMLSTQAQGNVSGVTALYNWVRSGTERECDVLMKQLIEADLILEGMEKNLTAAFVTPFDRGDIYAVSIGMNQILKYAESTMVSMQKFDLKANDTIINMVTQLKIGTDIFSKAVSDLKTNHQKSLEAVTQVREIHRDIKILLMDAMVLLLTEAGSATATKKYEVYHYIKDMSTTLERTANDLTRIIMRLT